MGYDLKVYIGSKFEDSEYVKEYARVDLFKLGIDVSEILDGCEVDKNICLYADDGNTKLTHDDYDVKLVAVKPKQILGKLRQYHLNSISKYDNDGKGFLPLRIAINTIEQYIEYHGDRCVLVFYGH